MQCLGIKLKREFQKAPQRILMERRVLDTLQPVLVASLHFPVFHGKRTVLPEFWKRILSEVALTREAEVLVS